MSTRIVRKRVLIPGQTTELVLEAPQIAAKARPGNFVILRVWEDGERIPLTIADTDPVAGTITLVFLIMGKTTAHLNTLTAGDSIRDLCGPLGRPTAIHKLDGPVICVGGGTGIAAMHHIAKGHQRIGNHVISIIGARCEDLLLFRNELCSFCPEVLISTNDGSCGRQGLVTDLLLERLKADTTVAEVVAVGPVPMSPKPTISSKAWPDRRARPVAAWMLPTACCTWSISFLLSVWMAPTASPTSRVAAMTGTPRKKIFALGLSARMMAVMRHTPQ